ncbi:GDP-4-dehydro-6-deoxy-D-mannose reductase [Myxococcus xanthus DK 1622]|uniref:GDP-4-dehydro-6-deoxy-D-mannose reductase n=1 Tax=Myxococcus xanthus (strain DK1622) TaxID=246197 RepID=Q1D1J5_MYXXD|nr:MULTISPECIES: GDP-mannose 4,6-dehydratase [Myxococcus]ABF87804.1 GDP-4-dehydro-6-deoxy-D-mannose reductase [Myxococcus xanthus DK 1622]NOJ54722.1 NAD-dependent epimerase/dehydratase family protein [Myxococcus xanthus]QPM77801.1 GDP-mannose 4,6-dehydratase [Myxococcus xanthus]QVW66869.1 GDP-mannose 4,6-dehydratase [Myxococcus xanthus DZ2]QZZ52984.1 GDP-6-deoxy-D-mannose reductase [Myxococcus xanthus]
MRILVTGADGFVGRHLCALLRAAGDEVVEAHGPRGEGINSNALHFDVANEASVKAAVAEVKPEGIIHLAGFSSVAKSHHNPSRVFAVNTMGVVHLLTAVRESVPKARVVLVGSGEVYGPVPEGTRATEDTPAVPLSPYAASKSAAELAAVQFHRSYGLEVVMARPFNHLGAGQDPTFVVPSFAAQIRAIGLGTVDPVLRTGNLDAVRDFSHVRDVVEAYRLLLDKGEPGQAYNIGSGEGRTIRSLLEEMLSLAGVSARIELDPARLRPSDIPSLVGAPDKLKALGWVPKLTVADALRDVLGPRVPGAA